MEQQSVILDDVYEWLKYGIERGFCSDPVCHTHDGVPYTDDEDEEWNEGFDPCVPAVRLYEQD